MTQQEKEEKKNLCTEGNSFLNINKQSNDYTNIYVSV